MLGTALDNGKSGKKFKATVVTNSGSCRPGLT